MTDEEWKEYQSNTKVMFDSLEACLQQLLRSRRNINISRTGNSDEGRKVQVEITNSLDLEIYVEYVNFRKDVLKYFKKMKKYSRHVTCDFIREVFVLDVGFGLTGYEFKYPKSLVE